MENPSVDENELLAQARNGDATAVGRLFALYRRQLRRLIEIRLDPRLAGRIDASDVLQDAYLDVHNRIREFGTGKLPFYLWLRMRVQNRLVDLHRFHLGAKKRNAAKEISLPHGIAPVASSFSLAACLLGNVTSPSNALIRSELRARVQKALNEMDEIDREVLVLRHFEDLTNSEVAQVLAVSPTAASNRYVRALRRLKTALDVSTNQ